MINICCYFNWNNIIPLFISLGNRYLKQWNFIPHTNSTIQYLKININNSSVPYKQVYFDDISSTSTRGITWKMRTKRKKRTNSFLYYIRYIKRTTSSLSLFCRLQIASQYAPLFHRTILQHIYIYNITQNNSSKITFPLHSIHKSWSARA